MAQFHVKKNDTVVVIAGSQKGKRGRIITVQSAKQRIVVEGVNMIKKHMRKSQQYPQGQIVEREGSIHVSNVMLAERYDAKHGGAPAAAAPAKA
jgi:large subunit ribosomal protein L24